MSGINADVRGLVEAYSSKQGFSDTLAQGIRQEGSFKGQAVVEIDHASALAEAAEEMTFAAAEKVEKRIAERKAGSRENLRLSAAEIADKYVNMMGESTSGQKLQEFMDSLKKRGSNLTEADIRQLAGQMFSDVTEQYGAMAYVEEMLEQEGGQEELLAKVNSAKEALMKEAGPAIRAGLNIAADVLSFSKQGLEQLDKLRDLYRFAVLGRQTVSDMYQAIMSRYGESRFAQALDFLIQAAGHDLDAGGLGPSMENAQLETAVNNINYVQQMGNLHRMLADLIDRVRPEPRPMFSYAR